MTGVARNIKLLSIGFLLVFFGFGGAQHYITTYLTESGMPEVGFNSLLIIYLSFALSGLLSAVVVSKHGAKRSMIVASVAYSLFIILLPTKSAAIIYAASAVLGIFASIIWTGQNSYLIRASSSATYGKDAGYFNTYQMLGSALGALIFGALAVKLMFARSFLIFALFPIAGIFVLSGLKDIKITGNEKTSRFALIKKALLSATALRLSCLWFAVNFIYGLVIGIIPLRIEKIMGVGYIGILSSLFYLLPILASYHLGKLSDTRGRKKMIVVSYALLILGCLSLMLEGAPFLILGIALFALNWAITKPITLALVGDVSERGNIEYLTALFWMVQNFGVVSALLLSRILDAEAVYLASLAIISSSIIVLYPLSRLGNEEIKTRISNELK